MTLADYLNAVEFQTTHVMVSHGNEEPHAEYHPFEDANELAVYRQIWTLTYYRYQENRATHERMEQEMVSHLSPHLRKGVKSSLTRKRAA